MNLTEILNAIYTATAVHPTAFNTKDTQTLPAINYQAYRTSDNGATAKWRMEVRCIASTYAAALTLEEQVKDALVSIGNNDPVAGNYIYINGGGSLEDETTGLPMLITYYDITNRS